MPGADPTYDLSTGERKDHGVIRTDDDRVLVHPNSSAAADGTIGTADCVTVTTELRFTRADLVKVLFRGTYLACIDPRSLDMSVLGRDLLEMLAVIVDFAGHTVCLLAGQHKSSISPS